MNDRLRLLEAVLADHKDNSARLCYADQLELDGEERHAELIRTEIAISELDVSSCEFNCLCPTCSEWSRLVKIVEGIKSEPIRLPGGYVLHWRSSFSPAPCYLYDEDHNIWIAEVWRSRGFISTIRISWENWLPYHGDLFWSPKLHTPCDDEDCLHGITLDSLGGTAQCRKCSPVPVVASALPLELVKLTTPIAWDWHEDTVSRWVSGVGRFWQEECSVCGGRYKFGAPVCKTCKGKPPNRWMADKWPGLRFQMTYPSRGSEVDFTDDYSNLSRSDIS